MKLWFGLFLVVVLSLPALAVTISTADGRGSDVALYNTYGGKSDGGSVPLAFGMGAGWITMLKFDLSTAPAVINDASISIKFTQETSWLNTISVYGVLDGWAQDGYLGEDWYDSQVVMSGSGTGLVTNQHGGRNSPNASLYGGAALTTKLDEVSAGSYLTLSGGTLVEFLNTDTNDLVTFIITCSQGPDFIALGGDPKLTVTPEPVTLVLLGLGGLALRRRMR